MSLTRKPAPKRVRAAPLDFLETDKERDYRPRVKPVYTGRTPGYEEEDMPEEWEVARERRLRLSSQKTFRELHTLTVHNQVNDNPAHRRYAELEDGEDDDEELSLALPDADPHHGELVQELARFLTGDADRDRTAKLHQSRLDHARRDGTSAALNLQRINAIGEEGDGGGEPAWIESQADIRESVAGSRCYVKGYTPKKVKNPQRAESSLELV